MARPQKNDAQDDGILEKLVTVRRTSCATKGGSTFSFSALVVTGDGEGKIGYGLGKSKEVPLAIKKATEAARKAMVFIPLKKATLYHDIFHRSDASKVIMLPASDGTGIIAGTTMRAVFEVMGVKNVLSKCIGSTNPVNVIRATIKGLQSMMTPKSVAQKRGKSINEIFGIPDEK